MVSNAVTIKWDPQPPPPKEPPGGGSGGSDGNGCDVTLNLTGGSPYKGSTYYEYWATFGVSAKGPCGKSMFASFLNGSSSKVTDHGYYGERMPTGWIRFNRQTDTYSSTARGKVQMGSGSDTDGFSVTIGGTGGSGGGSGGGCAVGGICIG